ncbi:MAG: hypothetical protein VB141_13320 [Burkholderia gladioli]
MELKLSGSMYRAGEYRILDRETGNVLEMFGWDEAAIRQTRDCEWMVNQGSVMRAAYERAAQYEREAHAEDAYRRRK